MADRAHRCKCGPLAADAVCVPKCPMAAAVGVLLLWSSSSERDGPHARNDLRANGFFGSVSAACAGLLFFAAAFRRIDLSSDPSARQPPKPRLGTRFLRENDEELKETHATNFFSCPFPDDRHCVGPRRP